MIKSVEKIIALDIKMIVLKIRIHPVGGLGINCGKYLN
jgi:hypothetical protein